MGEEKKTNKKEDEIVINEGENNIEISNDVVAVIAGMAASEVSGVAEMSGGFAGGISEVLSGKKNLAKGIKVEILENKESRIDVNIIVEYGARIPEVAFEIQKRVKKSVENMTGLNVLEVNVHVQGVSTVQKEEQKEETVSKKEDSKEEKRDEKGTKKETKKK